MSQRDADILRRGDALSHHFVPATVSGTGLRVRPNNPTNMLNNAPNGQHRLPSSGQPSKKRQRRPRRPAPPNFPNLDANAPVAPLTGKAHVREDDTELEPAAKRIRTKDNIAELLAPEAPRVSQNGRVVATTEVNLASNIAPLSEITGPSYPSRVRPQELPSASASREHDVKSGSKGVAAQQQEKSNIERSRLVITKIDGEIRVIESKKFDASQKMYGIS
jgi:hypothetical protein